LDKPVERLVRVERTNDIVAVFPGAGIEVIDLKTSGVGITDDIEPVPPPAFAIARTANKRSTTFAQASGLESVTNASTSSGVGGKPRRSRVTRRRRVRLSAGGAG
jgi:hypothetical protein